jgi:hypothetical protein
MLFRLCTAIIDVSDTDGLRPPTAVAKYSTAGKVVRPVILERHGILNWTQKLHKYQEECHFLPSCEPCDDVKEEKVVMHLSVKIQHSLRAT